jgi:hypothetical protein
MANKLDQLIGIVYRKWKQGQPLIKQPHPDEEVMACFFEGKLAQEESEQIKMHLISCDSCSEAFALSLKLKPESKETVPQELIEQAKNILPSQDIIPIIAIAIMLKEKALEILETTGDVLVGQEFIPAPVLRSRKITEFKDEVTILKDSKDTRIEIKIENKGGKRFDLIVFVKDKLSQHIIKDLRVTLLKGDLELESYLSNSERVIFEHVSVGKYVVEISNIEDKIASILLDIRR